MPNILDITGYTWVGNNAEDITIPVGTHGYSLNFKNGSDLHTYFMYGIVDSKKVIRYGDGTLNTQVLYGGSWIDDAYKTIEITGGTDATNSTLIAWLEANGTLTAPILSNDYTLTHNLTNVSKGNTKFTITPDAGYELPSSVSVSNGTLVSYDSTTGEVVVSGDNAVISAECVASAPSGYSVTITDIASIDNSVIVDIYDGADTTGTLLYSSYDATTPISLTISSGYVCIYLSASGSISNISATGGVSYVGYVGYGDGIYYSVANDGTITIRTDD